MHDAVNVSSDFDPFDDDDLIDGALRAATQDALRMHRALGNPIVVLRGGSIVRVSAQDIPADGVFPPEPDDATDNPPPKR